MQGFRTRLPALALGRGGRGLGRAGVVVSLAPRKRPSRATGWKLPAVRLGAPAWAARLRMPRWRREERWRSAFLATLALRLGLYLAIGLLLLVMLGYARDLSKSAVDDALTRFARLMLLPIGLGLVVTGVLACREILRAVKARTQGWGFDPDTGLGVGDYGSLDGSRRRRKRRRR